MTTCAGGGSLFGAARTGGGGALFGAEGATLSGLGGSGVFGADGATGADGAMEPLEREVTIEERMPATGCLLTN